MTVAAPPSHAAIEDPVVHLGPGGKGYASVTEARILPTAEAAEALAVVFRRVIPSGS